MNTPDDSVLSQKEATVILKNYTSRPLCYSTVDKVRGRYHDILFSDKNKRIEMFPDFVKRLREVGHEVEYGCVGAEKMREYTIASAANLHRLKHKNDGNSPEFDPKSVDLSGIVDVREYISW